MPLSSNSQGIDCKSRIVLYNKLPWFVSEQDNTLRRPSKNVKASTNPSLSRNDGAFQLIGDVLNKIGFTSITYMRILALLQFRLFFVPFWQYFDG